MTDHLDVASLLADPMSVSVEQIPDVIGELEKLKAMLWSRLTSPVPQADAATDRLLTAAEAAPCVGMSTDWLYRHADRLPFTRRTGRRAIRFSERGIRAYLNGLR